MEPDIAPESVRRLDDGTIELELPADTRSVTAARRFISTQWGQLDQDILDDVRLIITELVANAVRHGRPEICLRLRNEPFAIDVAVLDHGAEWPRQQSADEIDGLGHGRGLAIIQALASAWGVQPLPPGEVGKIVWASIERV